MHHVIKTQIINVATDNSNEVFSLQHKLSNLFYRVMVPVLEKLFDDLAPGDQVVYLDSVEIDLGIMTTEEMEKKEWPDRFKEMVYRQFKEIVLLNKIKNTDARGIPGASQQWLHYMQFGSIPWNTLRTDALWYKKVLEEFAKNFYSIDLLRKLLISDARAVRRIVLLHDPFYLAHLIEVLTAQKQNQLVLIMETLFNCIGKNKKLTFDTGKIKSLKQQAWESIFVYTAAKNKNATEAEIIQNAILKNLSKDDIKQVPKQKNVPQELEPFIPAIKKIIQSSVVDKTGNQQTDLQKEVSIDDGKIKIPEEGIFVKYAGLVILHPFLNQFFKRMNLTANGKFKDKNAQQKAISLLNYAATGNTFFEEHELVVHKVMCGFPLHDIIDPVIELDQIEKDEADSLLEAVISEWSILKNSTIDGLRESFLQRNGKFINVNSVDIRLMVETHALDVLLDHLPWALSIIKFSWMPQVLKVDWK